jgi:hypothetical protein
MAVPKSKQPNAPTRDDYGEPLLALNLLGSRELQPTDEQTKACCNQGWEWKSRAGVHRHNNHGADQKESSDPLPDLWNPVGASLLQESSQGFSA